MNRGNIPWLGGPSIKQNFSLPTSIIYYMAKNPSSPEVYNKLIQSCKYFFEQNPILVAADIYRNFGNKPCICPYVNCSSMGKCCVDIEINKISSKFWLINGLYIDDKIGDKNFLYLLSPKLYQSDIEQVLVISQDVMFDDFKILISSSKEVSLVNAKMSYKDGNIVMLDTILGSIPCVERFNYDFPTIGTSFVNALTLTNILKLKNLGHLEFFRLMNIPEVFEVKDLSFFIKNLESTTILFKFDDNLSEGYKVQLDALIDTVIESDIPNRCIVYDGQDEEKLKILKNRGNCNFYFNIFSVR